MVPQKTSMYAPRVAMRARYAMSASNLPLKPGSECCATETNDWNKSEAVDREQPSYTYLNIGGLLHINAVRKVKIRPKDGVNRCSHNPQGHNKLPVPV
jgi:hypothetical protein